MARKMLLVPSETIQKENERAMNDLDGEMTRILNQNLDDREKWVLYQQTLQRFNRHATLARQPMAIDFMDNTVSLDKIPLKYRVKARKVLSTLADNTAVQWDDIGEVTIHGKTLKGSNIVDFIREFVNPTKSRDLAKTSDLLPGYDSFVRVIAEATPIRHTPIRQTPVRSTRVIRKWIPYKKR